VGGSNQGNAESPSDILFHGAYRQPHKSDRRGLCGSGCNRQTVL